MRDLEPKYVHKSDYFYGKKISDYGLKNGYVDYYTLSRAFDAVLCNDITKLFYSTINGDFNECELVNGFDYDEENDAYNDVYQWFIISDRGAEILQDLTDEIVYYIPVLDIYVWGVTHFGTGWDYVLTDIKIEKDEE